MSSVKELPEDDRPREKLILRGAQNLSDSELIAIMLRTGIKGKTVLEVARELTQGHKNLAVLSTLSLGVLTKIGGIGKDKAATLLAAFEVGKRIAYSESKWMSDNKITSPQDVADYFIPRLKDEIKERFLVVCLGSSNKIIKWEEVSVGNLDSSIVHPREVFKVAIDNNAKNLILVHNHPSGNPEPSNEDIAITKKLIEVGKIFEIPIFDHIIIAGNSYTSFIERRLI
ncbi:MAG: DNA repair protein RadC [Ignavibacteria bacterium]|jgi:DNA repair protein RadC|nr:DNA repair protein RadC [Ignavibacteria bacterium]